MTQTPQTAPSDVEELIWAGTPAQWSNFWLYFWCVLGCWLIVPIFIAGWRWLQTRSFRYELTSERLKVRWGVFSRKVQELELYRVKDYSMQQSFVQRLVGIGTIILDTSDRTTPVVEMRSIRAHDQVQEKVRAQVERLRDRKRVREVDGQWGEGERLDAE